VQKNRITATDRNAARAVISEALLSRFMYINQAVMTGHAVVVDVRPAHSIEQERPTSAVSRLWQRFRAFLQQVLLGG